jgi:hypothetical protein
VTDEDRLDSGKYPHDLRSSLLSGADAGVRFGVVFGAVCCLGSVVAVATSSELSRRFSRQIGVAIAGGFLFVVIAGIQG